MVACIVCGGECSRLDVLDLNRSCDIGQGQVFLIVASLLSTCFVMTVAFVLRQSLGDGNKKILPTKFIIKPMC